MNDTARLILSALVDAVQAVRMGAYTALGVVAAYGFDAAVGEPWRVAFAAGVTGGLRALELLGPKRPVEE